MKTVLVVTASVLGAVGIGVGSLAAAGQASLPAPATSHAHLATSVARSKGAREGAKGFCGTTASVTGAVLRRHVGLPQNHPKFSFPRVEQIAGPSARRLARVLCDLPSVPSGETYSCPVDLGIDYTLTFATASRSTVVSVDPWGCEWVQGAIGTRWTKPALWHVLGVAIGRPHATRATFAGHIPGM